MKPLSETLTIIPRFDIPKLGAWLQFQRDEASKRFDLSLSILLGAMLHELNGERKRRYREAGIEVPADIESWFQAQVDGEGPTNISQ